MQSNAADTDQWVQTIFNWADEFQLSESEIPRNKDKLLAMTYLILRSSNDENAVMKITYLPEDIGKLINLTSLNVINQKLTTLPHSIGQLSHLASIEISDSPLTELPESVGLLSNLTELYIDNCPLIGLPKSISCL